MPSSVYPPSPQHPPQSGYYQQPPPPQLGYGQNPYPPPSYSQAPPQPQPQHQHQPMPASQPAPELDALPIVLGFSPHYGPAGSHCQVFLSAFSSNSVFNIVFGNHRCETTFESRGPKGNTLICTVPHQDQTGWSASRVPVKLEAYSDGGLMGETHVGEWMYWSHAGQNHSPGPNPSHNQGMNAPPPPMSQGGYVPQPSNSHVRKRSSPDDHDSHHSPHKRPISTPAYNMQGPSGYHQPPAPYPDARPVSGNPGGNPASYTYGSFDQPQGQYGGAYGQDTAPRNPNPYQSGPPPPTSAPAPGPPPFAGNELAAPPSNSGAAWSSSSPVPPNGMNYYPQAAYSQAPMHPLQRPPPPPMPQFSNGLNPGMDPFGGQGGGEDEPAPVLFRTSTLSSKGQMPLSASTASALPPPPTPGANSNNPTDPNAPGWVYQGNKATLKIIGELDDMGSNWLPEEWATRRRLVQFWRQQKGNTINCTFRPVLPANRVPNSICVSCIWWEEKQDCFVTSVDCIYLLEALVGVRFTVEEKNRIRRNLEGFRPLTVSKTKPESEEFFKLIMGFPNPKPRNIEKDVKVFPWRILGGALKKIIGKYTIQSASYEGQEGATPTPQQATPPAAYNNSQQGPPAPPQQQPFDGQPQYQPGPSPNMQQQHGSAPQSSQACDNDGARSAHSVHSGHNSSSTSRPQSQAHYSPQQARQPPPKLQLEMPPPSNNAPPAVQPSVSTLPPPQPSGQGNQLPVPGGNMSTLPSPNTYRLPFPAPIGAPGAARGSFDFSEFFSQSPATANPQGPGLGMSGMPPPTSAPENDGASNVRDEVPAKQEG